MKTLVIDALSAQAGGGVTYLTNLFTHFDRPNVLKVLVLVSEAVRSRLSTHPSIEVIAPPFPSKGLVHRLLWYRFRLLRFLRENHVDAVYFPGGSLAPVDLSRYRIAVAFRNMLPFAPREIQRFPYGYIRARLRLLRWIQGRSFRRANLMVFLSEHSRKVIDELLPSRGGACVVIPHGINESFRATRSQAVLPQAPHGYVLYVSILDVYKAQLQVVQAWQLLRLRRVTPDKLVLIGPENPWYARRVRRLIERLGLQDEVVILGEVPYHDIPLWYKGAKVNLFASSCENCPNILLEALASGRPMLCSNYMPMPEFAGDAAGYFDPYDPESLATLLVRYLDDEGLREMMATKAKARSQMFDWRHSAQKTWDALERLAYQ